MATEFIGHVAWRKSSETIPASESVIDRRWISSVAKAHEHAGFDRALVA
jgi:alkanesulfonate monooxygenase